MDDLILRSLRGETSAREEAELETWRSSAPENERHYREVVAISRLATTPTARPRETPPPAGELIRQAERRTEVAIQHPLRGRHIRPWRSVGLAAAASIAIIALASSLYLWHWLGPVGRPHEIVAGPSETMTVALEDGSVVRLAPGSHLRLDPRRGREVALEGRGYFAVARSADRPFRVRTGAGDAIVLGTRFELSAANDELRLVVVDGRVTLDSGNAHVDVRDGQESRIVQGTISAPAPVDATATIGWLGRFLVFQETPMPAVAGDLERLYGMRVLIADSALAKQTITGWYSDRTFDEVFDIICRVLDAHCSIEAEVATIGARRGQRQ